MIILGIDPGYALTGFGVIEEQAGRLKLLDYGAISTAAKMPFEKRLLSIHEGMHEIIKKYHPAVVAVEEIFFAQNRTTAMGVAQARGVIILSAAQYKLPVYEYTPVQIKQSVTGNGRADKKQVQAMVMRLLNIRQFNSPDDAADALAIAICQAHTGPRSDFRSVSGYQ